MKNGQVLKINTSTLAATDITPASGIGYAGITLDPKNSNRIVVASSNAYHNDQFGTSWGDFIYLTTDGGNTWTSKLTHDSKFDTNGFGWMAYNSGIHWGASIEFDPLIPSKVRVTSGNGLFTCDNIDANPTTWKADVKGMEETVVLDAISIPGGKFISAVGDQYGAAYTDIYAYPAQNHQPTVITNNGIAYAVYNTNKVVRATNKLYYSNDQGQTWIATDSTVGGYGKVALSGDGNTILHCPGGSSTTYYSTDNGTTWASTGVTDAEDAAPQADYVNRNKFYIYSRSSGKLWVSTNKGVSFTASASNPGQYGSPRARSVPGNEGHVWVALYGNGLKYTTDSGNSWTTVPNVTNCKAVGFGKAATGATYPAVYIWGTVSGVTGIFRSTDQGASWTRINDDAHEWGGVGNGNFVMGDLNVYGRVYMCTVGRGLVTIESGSSSKCTPTAITPYVQVNGGTWTQTSSATVASGSTVILGPQPTSGGSWNWSGMATGTSREVTFNPTSSGTATATYTNTDGCQSIQVFTITVPTISYVTIVNRATGLLIDGMGKTSAGSACGQYASSGSWNQMWTLETSGAYVYIKNRNTGLYIDGRGNSTDGTYAGQWSSSTSDNLQWQQETVGSYVKFKNRATGLYLDGMGNTTNGGSWSMEQ